MGSLPYSKGKVCSNGIFNYMAANMDWDQKRKATGNSWMEDRFGPLRDSYKPAGYEVSPELIAKDALDVGTSITENRSKYQSPKDPKNVPFYFGYVVDENGRVTAGVWNFDFTINYAPVH